MRVVDRLFLFLYSLVFLIVSLVGFLVAVGFFKYRIITEFTYRIYSNYQIQWTVAVISIVIFLLSIYFIVKSFQTKQVASFFNKTSEHGEVRISMEALENIASKAATKVKGVKDLKVRVRPEENETITTIIKIYVDGETPIPQISEEIQEIVKQQIEHIAGIQVSYVHVIVSNIGQSNAAKKARIE